MMLDQSIVPKVQSDILVWISFLLLFSAAYALLKRQYDIAALTLLCFFTSINYWADPQYGFRRDLDRIVVGIGFCYLAFKAKLIHLKNNLFWACLLGVCAFYVMGWYIYLLGHIWPSTLLHCGVHLCGNASIVLFCSNPN